MRPSSRFAGSFAAARVRVCDLWALSEADYARLVPALGPRRRVQAYVRARAEEIAQMARVQPPMALRM